MFARLRVIAHTCRPSLTLDENATTSDIASAKPEHPIANGSLTGGGIAPDVSVAFGSSVIPIRQMLLAQNMNRKFSNPTTHTAGSSSGNGYLKPGKNHVSSPSTISADIHTAPS